MSSRVSRTRRGLTLIEVIVALALFVIATLAMMSIWPVQARAVDLARNVLTATEIGERELEAVLAPGFPQVVNRSGSQTVMASVDGNPATATFTYTLTVTSVSTFLKDVIVRVEWTEGGVKHEVALETLVAPKE